LVTEFCAGGSLAEKDLAELSTLQRLRLFGQIAEAIAYAHGKGVVHRDLKPENIFLRAADGPAVVGDFGLCFVEDGERHTLMDEGVGSRFFIAPELEDGKAEEISPRGDVYSLGKVLYWLVSSKRRFAREKHRTDANDLVRMTGDRRLEQVNRLLDQMITENPTTRFENASSVVAALQETTPLIEGGFNVLSRNSPQHCTYCGRGKYGVHATKHSGVQNFGLTLTGDPNWRILVCDVCGHVQLFRIDLAKERDWI
jgi:serine/threonine protein kinase